jgi:hypothetical protein
MINKNINPKALTNKPYIIVRKYGYEYLLVEGSDRKMSKHPQPQIFGMNNMALKAVRKIK